MARQLQDLCHSDPDSHAKRERLPACRKLRVEADGVAEPSGAVSYERRIHVRPTGRGDSREHRPTRARRVRRRMRRRFRGAGPPSLAAEEGKPHCFGTCAMSGTAGPPGSWSDYNHYEVSVTVANPRAVFGRDAIDMMGSIQSIATTAPGRSARRKWFHPGISLAPSRDAAAATAAVRLGPAACLNRGDAQRQSPRASDLDTRYPTNPKIGGTR